MLQNSLTAVDYSAFTAGFIVFAREKKNLSCQGLTDLLPHHYDYQYKIEKGRKGVSPKKFNLIMEKLDLDHYRFLSLMSEYILHLQQTSSVPSSTNNHKQSLTQQN
jgi:hypothetical protein